MEDNLKKIRDWTGDLNLKNEEFLEGSHDNDLTDKINLENCFNLENFDSLDETDLKFEDNILWREYHPKKTKRIYSDYEISFSKEFNNSVTSTNLILNPNINLNLLMSCLLVLEINYKRQTIVLSQLSLRSLYFLSNLATGREISKGPDRITIPLVLANLVDESLLKRLGHNTGYFSIRFSHTVISPNDYYLEVGFKNKNAPSSINYTDNYDSDRMIIFSSRQLWIYSNESLEYYTIIKFLILDSYIPFLVVWYIINEGYLNSSQALQPEMLEAKLKIKLNDNKYVKVYNIKDIKKINVGNYMGYLIPFDTFTISDLKCITLSKNKGKYFTKIEELIKWSKQTKCKLEISWSNYQPGFKTILEPISINRAFVDYCGLVYYL